MVVTEDDLGSEDEEDDENPAVLRGKPWIHRPEPKARSERYSGVEPGTSDCVRPVLEVDTTDQPIGSNFMFPYNLQYNAHYLDGFHRTTLANYNNKRKW
ncbi:hypothetical protein KCU81_g3917, partial [Aureobasidium melanogenum]